MPLQKQNINFPLAQGLNTKVDPKQQPPGTFKVLQNVKFTTMGEFKKRNGYSAINLSSVGGSAVQNSIGLSSFKTQLLALTKSRVFSYAESGGVWNNEGPYSILGVESKIIRQDNTEQTELQCAYLNNLKVFTWCETNGGINRVRISVVDTADETFIVNDQVVPGQSAVDTSRSISALRMVEFDNRIWIFYVVNAGTDADKLMVRKFEIMPYINGNVAFADAFSAETDINLFTVIGLLDNTKYIYDVAAGNQRLVIGLYDDSSDLVYMTIKKDSNTGGSISYSTEAPSVCMDLHTDPNGRIVSCWVDTGTNLKLQVMSDSLSLLSPTTTPNLTGTAPFSTYSSPTFTAKNVCAGSVDSDNYTVFVQGLANGVNLYDTSTSTDSFDSTTNNYKYNWTLNSVKKNTYTLSTTTAGTIADVLKGVGIASKAFTDGVSVYFNAVWDSEFQNTYFTVRADGSIHSKISDGVGGGLLNTTRYKAGDSTGYLTATYNIPSLSNVVSIDSNNLLCVSKIKGKIVNNDSKFYTLSGMNSSILSFDSQVGNQSVSIADNLHLAGGQLRMYDGAKSVEHGFTTFPPVLHVPAATDADKSSKPGITGTFPLPDSVGGTNVWNYRTIYTWTDAQGNIHRSGLSALKQITNTTTATTVWESTVTYTSGVVVMSTNDDGLNRSFTCNVATSTGNNPFTHADWVLESDGYADVTVALPVLNLTDKFDVKLELYRTKVNASIYYKVTTLNASSTTNPLVSNDKDYKWMLMKDALSDSKIATNEILYTTGNEVENIAAPSNSIVESFKNRVFIAGLENKLEMRYSKLIQLLSPVSFNDTGDYQIFVSEVGGDITALKAMDDKLIIFKEHAIFYLAGDGPDNTGQFNNFIEPTLISSDVGCVRKNSPVFTPMGVFFKSSKGIFLLTRSLGLEYKGAPAEDYNPLTIMDSDTVADQDQVRFLTSDGDTIVYNYILDRWCTFNNHRGLASRMVGNDYYYLNTSGDGNLVYKEVVDKFDDNGNPVEINLETGWISFAGIQGYQRVYRMMVLGEYKTNHSLKVKIAYDFDDEYVDELTMKFFDITSSETGVDIENYQFGNPPSPGVYGDPGSSTSYATAIAYGGKNNNQYQVKINLKKQKCESFKIRIENLQKTEQTGEGLVLSNLAFVVGIKGTEYKIKSSRVFGTS